MRTAYLIQSHGQAPLLPRLVRRLRAASEGPILVVHDAREKTLDESALDGTGTILLQRRESVRRGDFSLLEPYLVGAERLLASGEQFEWLVYLSAQSYPVRPVGAIEHDLATSGADGFIAHWDVTAPDSPWPTRRAQRRYWHQYVRLPDRFTPWLRLLRPLEAVTPLQFYLTYGALVGWPSRRPPFAGAFRCYGSWQWHSLHRRCVEHLLAEIAANPELVAYYKHTVVPDESFIATVLVNSARFRLVPESRHYADSHGQPLGHTRVLTEADLSLVTNGRHDFARKLDPATSAALLDSLDAPVPVSPSRTASPDPRPEGRAAAPQAQDGAVPT